MLYLESRIGVLRGAVFAGSLARNADFCRVREQVLPIRGPLVQEVSRETLIFDNDKTGMLSVSSRAPFLQDLSRGTLIFDPREKTCISMGA